MKTYGSINYSGFRSDISKEPAVSPCYAIQNNWLCFSMGTWGPELFDCDIANDIRDAFIDLIRLGTSADDATEELQHRFADAINDADDGPIFWPALAMTQWKLGRLSESVRANALKTLAKPIDEKFWGELYDARVSELHRLVEILNSDQPKKKKIKIWRPKLHPGDVFKIVHSEKQTIYGRVLVVFPPEDGFPEHAWAAYYAKDGAEQAAKSKRNALFESGVGWHEMPAVEIEPVDVLNMDIGLISHYPNEFDEHQPEVIGHVPLEERFSKPIYFYQRITNGQCKLFNIFSSNRGHYLSLSMIPAGVPQWNDFNLNETLKRLGLP